MALAAAYEQLFPNLVREGVADHPGLIWRALGQIELRMPFVPFSFALVSMRQRQNS